MGKKRKLKFSHESKGLSDSSSDGKFGNYHISSYVYRNKIKIVLPLSRNNHHQKKVIFSQLSDSFFKPCDADAYLLCSVSDPDSA
jgi:hypothetical protein